MFDKIKTQRNADRTAGGEGAVMLQRVNVDMISVCGADGSLQPLRFRFEDESREIRLAKVLKVLSCQEIRYVDIEAYSFSCLTRVGESEQILDLRYSVRGHRWWMNRRIYR